MQTLFFSFFLLFSFSTLWASVEISTALKQKKFYPMGEKIYAKKCAKIDPNNFENYEALRLSIERENLCGTLKSEQLDAVSLYLFDLKRSQKSTLTYPKLTASKDEKCPVCGMFLYKYPKWISRINYKNSSYGFDGIKDMMKYYFDHQEGVKEMLVQEYYTQETLEAREAFFVLGSDVYGPMGNELLAFKDKASAKQFMLEHRGKKIVRFSELTKEAIYALDE